MVYCQWMEEKQAELGVYQYLFTYGHVFIAFYAHIDNMIDNIIVKDIICLGIMVVVFLSAYSITLIQQTALAQQKQTSTGNVTAQVVPQGTSLQVANKTAASTNLTGTTAPSGNVTAQVVPQGTSLTPSNNATGMSSNASQGSVSVDSKLNCQSIASTIGGIIVPNPSKVCDVLIPRQAPTIIGPGNMNMNKFSTINSIVEVASVSDLMIKQGGNAGGNDITEGSSSASGNTSSQRVFAMGEFSLLDPQLVTMVKSAVGYNWTIAAVHNHMVLEKPKMMFVHWSAEGELNTIINQIKNVLLTVSKVPTGGSSS
jgi:Domain of Unknown Function (DUF1259)